MLLPAPETWSRAAPAHHICFSASGVEDSCRIRHGAGPPLVRFYVRARGPAGLNERNAEPAAAPHRSLWTRGAHVDGRRGGAPSFPLPLAGEYARLQTLSLAAELFGEVCLPYCFADAVRQKPRGFEANLQGRGLAGCWKMRGLQCERCAKTAATLHVNCLRHIFQRP